MAKESIVVPLKLGKNQFRQNDVCQADVVEIGAYSGELGNAKDYFDISIHCLRCRYTA
jgi:hypothetical protein